MVHTLPTVDGGSASSPKSLPARIAGVIFSPRATYADVAARPRWVAMFLVVYLVTAAVATMNTRRVPKRSTAQPASGITDASASR